MHGDTTWKIKFFANKKYFNIFLRTTLIGNRYLLILNDKEVFYRNERVNYFESIGGVYIGMSKKDLFMLYGEPTRITKGNLIEECFYDDDLWKIRLFAGYVSAITIFKGGTRKFDRTGYDCYTSLSNYLNAYQCKNYGGIYEEGDNYYVIWTSEKYSEGVYIDKNLWPNEVMLVSTF